MRFLVDNALSPIVATGLDTTPSMSASTGCRRRATPRSSNGAHREGRVIVSADTDFGTLLAVRRERAPSVILFRRAAPREPRRQVEVLLANLSSLATQLDEGSVVVLEPARVRVRRLPIAGS